MFSDDYQSAQLLSLILELLTFCVEHHTYHIKNYIISKDVLRRVLVLLKSRHSFLALCKYACVVVYEVNDVTMNIENGVFHFFCCYLHETISWMFIAPNVLKMLEHNYCAGLGVGYCGLLEGPK